MPTPRQTVSFLTQRFAEAGIRLSTRHGQNFLIDLNLVELLVQTADVAPTDVVLEVGTGTGSLTAMLAQKAAAVVTVEIDPYLYQLARESLADCPNVVMLQLDALKNKHRFHPLVLEALRQELAKGPERRLKLAANLPYNIATPIISNLLAGEFVPAAMTVTIQKEVAERITAAPRSPDYGALSVWVQSQCHASVVRLMPPSVFWPKPKVDSAIVHIVVDPAQRAAIPDRAFFQTFIRAMFFHRRKLLRNELLSAFPKDLGKPDVDALLEQQQLSPTCRAEELSVATLLALCAAVRDRLGQS